VTTGGRLFYTRAAATPNARSLMVHSLVCGTMSLDEPMMLFCRTPVKLPYVDPVGGRYSIKKHLFTSSSYPVIKLKSLLGLQIIWDGNHFLQLSVAAEFRRSVCGLCGEFNLSNFDANFSGRRRLHAPTICARLDRPVNVLQLCL